MTSSCEQQNINITTDLEGILKCFIFIGLVTKIILSGISADSTNSNGPASINILIYTIILISMIGIFIYKIKKNDDVPYKDNIDLLIIIIYLFWVITINIQYFKNINLKEVPTNYFLYSNLFHYSLICSFILSGMTSNNTIKINNEDLYNKLTILKYLLTFINFILILIQQIILENFTVDVA